MKVIDLLNKIANGEDVPNEIIYHGNYYYNVGNKEQAYYENSELEDNLFLCAVYNEGYLNDEIEIIEDTPKEDRYINVCGSLFTKSEYDELAKPKEDKKIEKIGKDKIFNNSVVENEFILQTKIDEIIEVINERNF